MNTLFDSEAHLDRHEHPDTEFTLSTASLLGIFFGLAIVCGVFFGFGYSMGRRSTDSRATDTKSESRAGALNATSTATNTIPAVHARPAATQDLADQDKPAAHQDLPAAHQDLAQKTPAAGPATSTVEGPAAAAHRTPATPPAAAQYAAVQSAAAQAPALHQPARSASAAPLNEIPYNAAAVRTPPAARSAAFAPAAPTPLRNTAAPAMNAAPGPPQPAVVQIAAVSHQEDAEMLIAALRKRGYNVAIRHEQQDQLMHVQVGPFNNRADAVAMRQKLLADGYNAIVKP